MNYVDKNEKQGSVQLKQSEAERFLNELKISGRAIASVDRYRRSMEMLFGFLGEGYYLDETALEQWQDQLLKEGYAPRTVNTCLSAANSFLEFCGLEEYQFKRTLRATKVQPELSRVEYRRLLQTAMLLDKEQAYLMIKIFANTGIQLQDLQLVTGDAVSDGKLSVETAEGPRIVRLIEPLRTELMEFAHKTGRAGPLFVTQRGTPLNRSNVTQLITGLCSAAQVPKEKANPRCLRRLYQRTRAELEANMDKLLDMGMERIMEQEQRTAAWGK